ncbi:MAG TPA: hypothetical protein VL307_06285 [Chitinophagaceae bacterium]|nr:hypothetical protein [Chitinophagaceae bacterium]
MLSKKRLAAFLITLFCSLLILQAQQKRLYLANDDHTDYMWTANEAAYDSVFVKMIDYYLQQIDDTKNSAPALQVKYNLDGSFWVKAYEKHRSPAQFQRLLAAIRSGHISCPLNTLVSCYGAQPTEAVLRGMYYAGNLERKYNLRFPLAVSMENQTIPLGLASLWAGAGAKYSWRGVCGCATRFTNEDLSTRRHQLYNYRGLDGRGVIMKWYARTIFNGRTLGGYAECRRQMRPTDPVKDMGEVVDDLDKMCDTAHANAAYPFNVAAAFGYGWDDLANYNAPDFTAAAQRYSTPARKVIVSNEIDFFEDIAQTYPRLPVEQLSYGNEWDTYCASMNETTARVRRAMEQLRTAEALAAIAAIKGNDLTPLLQQSREQAWEALGLYWEHDWTADGPVSQKDRANWQIKLQEQVSAYADSLQQMAGRAIAAKIITGKHKRFYVFNALSWPRSGMVQVAVDDKETADNARVLDLSTGREVVSQLILRGGKHFVQLQVQDIPSLGYKIFEWQPGNKRHSLPGISVDNGVIKTKYYRLRVSPAGVITEWYDSLANSRPLVKLTEGRYINDFGSKDPGNGSLTVENNGPLSITLKAVSNDPLPHASYITLFANSPRIVIEDSILANFSKLSTWAFSFDLTNPTTHHEELGALLTAKKETRGGHYAAQNARYDWQTFNHFADLSEANYGISISNTDCSFFKLGNSTPDSLWETTAQLNALAGGQTDPYTGLSKNKKDTVMMGIYRQNGASSFRYHFALQAHNAPYDPITAMKFALDDQNPLIAVPVTGQQVKDSATSFSLLQVNDTACIVWSIKPAEEGIAGGLIARIWNFGQQPVKTWLQMPTKLQRANETTHLEINIKKLTPMDNRLPVQLGGLQMQSFRLQPRLTSTKGLAAR